MKRQIALLILPLLFFYDSLSQKAISPKELHKVFKRSISQSSKKRVSIGSNAWLFCNNDSSFFISDTVQMYSGAFEFINESLVQFTCCQNVEWTFYRSNRFVQSQSQACREPANGTLPKANDWFSLTITKVNDEIFIYASNTTISQRFKVARLWIDPVNDKYKVLTLVRINNG